MVSIKDLIRLVKELPEESLAEVHEFEYGGTNLTVAADRFNTLGGGF